MTRNILSVAFASLLLVACETTGGTSSYPGPYGGYPQQPQAPSVPQPETQLPDEPVAEVPTEIEQPDVAEPTPTIVRRDGLTPPHMQGRDIKRLAVLLPFSARSERLREEAGSMLKAAEMAVFARDEADVVLIALDTAGTSQGAAAAARAAVKSGADVILGPVLARSVTAAGSEARRSGTPIIAFSTDRTVAGNGTYLLSFPPEAEVKRVVDFAASTGVERFAVLGPESAYGRRVGQAYAESVKAAGGNITAAESYKGRDISVMQAPARKIAELFKENEKQVGRGGRMAFEAIMLPEGGTALRSLAPLMPYYDIDPEEVQFLGTGLWHREETVREPALNGGIFAGPDRSVREAFDTDYDRRFGEEPSRLASLAYDAVSIGAVVADGDPRGRRARTEDGSGFYGVDGLVKFNRDGTPTRGLAVYQIQNGRFVIIDPAPRTLGPS